MKLNRRATTATALATLTLGGMFAAAAPSSAATPAAATAKAAAASYNGACGSGYRVIDSTPIGRVGTTYVTWNESTGKNCAVTIRNTSGTPIYMEVSLTALDDDPQIYTDAGQFRSYAGPVYVNARGYCISWSGVIGNAAGSDQGHCG